MATDRLPSVPVTVTGAEPPADSADAARAVETRLRRFDDAALAAFVADLWAARGYETARSGTGVVVQNRVESLVVVPVGSRFGPPPTPNRQVDVVVAPRASRRARTLTERHDARLLDATSLREMLWYGVDRATTADLCVRHFGAAPAALGPPPGVRGRRWLRRGGRRLRTAGVPTVLTVLVLLGAFAGAGVLGVDGPGSGPPIPEGDPVEERSAGTTAGVATAGAGTGDGTPRQRGTAGPDGASDRDGTDRPSAPGVGTDGITDVTALAAAHDRGLRNRSYTLWLDGSPPHAGENASAVHRDTTVTVGGDGFLVDVDRTESGVRTDLGQRRGQRAHWDQGDGESAEASEWPPDLAPTGPLAPPSPAPGAFRQAAVTRYLATPETDLTGVFTRYGRTLYRLEGRGTPPAVEGVRDYRYVAFVTEAGVVRKAEVVATVATAAGPAPTRFEWTYGLVDATTVADPAPE